MSYPLVSLPLVRYCMYHNSASKNDPLDGNYKAALASYLIDVAAPMNMLNPYDIA